MSDTTKKIYLQLYSAIKTNQSPSVIFYQFLSSKDVKATYIHNQIISNKSVIQLITSTEGRAWIQAHLNEFLDYIALIAGCGC